VIGWDRRATLGVYAVGDAHRVKSAMAARGGL